jgi:hypothetical protein
MRGYKGKEADRLVTRIDPGVVALVAELRGHEPSRSDFPAPGFDSTSGPDFEGDF